MSNIRFTLDQLRALDAIDRLGSFAAAGGELRRATSAVSYAIKQLEAGLGLPLFDRQGHRAKLTPAGRVFLEDGRRVLAAARGLDRAATQLGSDWEPSLEVVLDGILPMAPIMTAVRAVSALEAPTRLRLRVEYLTGVRSRFEADDATLMLVIDWPGDPEMVAAALPPVQVVLLAHREHALHQLGRAPERADLRGHVELFVADSRPPQPATPRLALGSGHVFELSDFYSKREALLAGVGFGWLPAHLARGPMATGALTPLALAEGHMYTFEPFLVHRRDLRPGRAARVFMESMLGQR